jgi:hypothetical protein
MNERKRELARQRQLRKRRRDREARLDLKASTIAGQMPLAWRDEWLQRVERNRARSKRAAAEVEKTLPSIPESGRADFLERNRPNTRISIPELRNRFAREKWKGERADERRRDAEYSDEEVGGCEDDWEPSSRGNVLIFKRELGPRDWYDPNAIEIRFTELPLPGSEYWWMLLVYGEGGLGDKRVGGWRLSPNVIAIAWHREERRLAIACKCHNACVTSRPEYGLPAANRAPFRIFVPRCRVANCMKVARA